MKQRNVPGSIVVKSQKSGRKYLYILPYKAKKRQSTGLIDTPENRKICHELLKKAYADYLIQGEKVFHQAPEKPYLSEAILNFIDHLKQTGKQIKTIKTYASSIKMAFLNDYPIDSKVVISGKKIYKVEHNISRFVYENTEYRSTSINIHLRSLSAFLSYCALEEYLPPISLAKYKKREQEKVVESYTDDEIIKIVEYFASEPIIQNIVLFCYFTGSRISETLQLRWSQINLKTKTIALPNKVRKDKINYIPISEKVYYILEQMRDDTEQRHLYKTKVFPYSDSATSFLAKKMKKCQMELGIYKQGRGFHSLRKKFATDLFDSNVSIDIIQKLMRHSNINITLKHYNEYNQEQAIEALNKVGR
jgi:integrase